jgi:addiction module RelE/StbE family toxin
MARSPRNASVAENAVSREVIWSARSRRDLQSIDAYIGQFAPLAAQRFTARLVSTVQSLAENPERGRRLRGATRELVVVAPYLIRYRVTADAVEIIRIKHGAQRPD